MYQEKKKKDKKKGEERKEGGEGWKGRRRRRRRRRRKKNENLRVLYEQCDQVHSSIIKRILCVRSFVRREMNFSSRRVEALKFGGDVLY